MVHRDSTSAETAAGVSVDEPLAPKAEEVVAEPVKEDPPQVSVTEKDPFEGMKPGCTEVATPLPELPAYVEAVCAAPEPDDSEVSGTHVAQVEQASPTAVSPTPASPTVESPAPASPTLVSPPSASPAPPSPTVTPPPPGYLAPPSPTLASEIQPEPEPAPSPDPRSDFH